MRLGTRSARLLATISPLALTLALAAPATARTIIEPEIDVAQIIAAITTQTPANSANIINSSLATVNSSVSATVVGGTGSLDSVNNVADSNTSIDFEANTIFAIARGTDALNQIGTLDTGAAGDIDGAAIFNGGFTDTVDLDASVSDSSLTAFVQGSGAANLDTSFDSNLILAEGTFNNGVSTIETVIPGDDLADPVFSAGYVEPASNLGGGFTGVLLTAATLNVVNVQANFDFQSTAGDTAAVSGNEISLLRQVDDTNDPLSGNYGLTNNGISALGNGNVSDNSIFVREEIETGGGTETGSLLFEGSGAIANYQLSQDSIGSGITALNEDSVIDALFRFGNVMGGATTIPAENLSVDFSDNTVESSARLNASRNEITFDGAMQLSGQFSWDSITGFQQGIADLDEATVGTGSELTVSADFYTVNRQFILADGVSQVVEALTDAADVSLRIEDVDDDSAVGMNGNAITSRVSGNSGQNIIGNATPDAAPGNSPSVDTVLASVNSQYAEALDASASVVDSIIRTDIGFRQFAGGANIEGFGGFEGSSLTQNLNVISAAASGNAGTSSVGLVANTIDNSYDSDDGAASSIDNSGAFLSANRGNVLSSDEDFEASAGTTVLNSQRSVGGDGPATVDATLSGNTIRLYVNAHQLDPDTAENFFPDRAEDDGISGSSFEFNNNAMQSSATGNGFNSLVNHDAGTTYTGSVGTLSQQSLAATDVSALAENNTLDVDLAIGDAVTDNQTDVSVEVDNNQIVARGTGNQTTTTTLVTANTFNGGAWTGFNDGSGLEDTAAGAIQASTDANELSFGFATLNASLGALTDQLLVASVIDSLSNNNDVLVDVASEANDGGSIVLDLAGSIAVNNSTLGSQSRGNEADNLVALDVATTASSALGDNTNPDVAEYGPLAGIVSNQAISGDTGASVSATTTDNDVIVTTLGLLTGSLDASGNRVIANAIGNLIANEVTVSALSLDIGPTVVAAPPSSYIEDNGSNAADLYTDSSIFILNNQRNEAEDPESENRGAPVTATLDGGNSVDVDTDNITSSSVSVGNNLLQSTAAANSASNSISIDIGSGPIFTDILNRQGNSGDVTATNTDSSITLDINDFNAEGSDTTSANTNMAASLNSNQIGSAAFGSSVFNGISAAAGSNFTATPDVESSAETSSPTGTGAVDYNGDMEAHGNMVVLNSQRTYGFDGDPVNISATTESATIALNATGGMNQGSTSADNNRISAVATANDATNVISAVSGSGSGLPSATINNSQHASFANVTATVTAATISTTIGGAGVGANLGGSTSVAGGTISAAATGNSAVNRISSAGQSFTRSGSF